MIGLMDCNNFFVSCERLFRPDLQGKPVAVLSSNDGCIVARSNEVKALGVTMGIPYFEIKELCKKEKITLFSSNFSLYHDISMRIMSALKAEFEQCDVYSVDEAFFAIHDSVTEEELSVIRTRIIQKTGIPVSIGVAKTKTLAKVANGIAKKRDVRLTMSNMEGVCVLTDELWKETMENLSCGSIWGIGRQTSAFLTKSGIRTVFDLLLKDKAFIQQSLGVVGERLCMELSGISVYALGEGADDDQVSYTSTRSFSKPVYDKSTIMSALGYHVANVAEKLRLDGCVASKVTIVARGSRFGAFAHREGSLSSVLVRPTQDTFILMHEVSTLLDRLYDSEIPYKKAGVLVSGILPEGATTESLFEDTTMEIKTTALNAITDVLNSKFGSGTLRHAVTLGNEKWQEKKNLKSPDYTTAWKEIACVKAI